MAERPVLAARIAVESDTDRVIGLRAESERWLARRGIQQWTAKWDEVGREKIRRNIANRETWVFEDDGDVIATVTLNTRPDLDFWNPDRDGPALYLYKLLLARDRAGESLGADIVNWSVNQAALRGFPWLRLDVWRNNHGLQRYYLDQGFEHVRTVEVPGRDSGACFQRRAVPTPVENIVDADAQADV
ncbi:GNAT family N-acetyltransferase [Nonomuraea phyllanthi]|uniref:GNAT family N-acetyltransferase n=1 Tax=Nonomuraea phyllanthi TaxID=2219224 RepID=UPI001293826F|nr:GNAT family N-acetyltransferase [Nonomuraea phyllanthi]QFY05593.1 GNAT family N-acetyltransferase [Nonomuraea phyllanthi]